MRLIALLAQSTAQEARFSQYRDETDRFIFAPVQAEPFNTLLPALARSGFAGALVFDDRAQQSFQAHVGRSTVAAQDAGRIDAIGINNTFMIGEYTVGNALATLLEVRKYHLNGADIVIVGSNPIGQSLVNEVAKGRPRSIVVIGANQVEAERMLPSVSGVHLAARAALDPSVQKHIENADFLIRLAPVVDIPLSALGPHLLFLDMMDDTPDQLKRYAEAAGASVYGARELELFRVQRALEHILQLSVSPRELQKLLRNG